MLNIPEEVKRALRAGDLRKNYKMKVNDVDPDTGERTYVYTIDNDTLVKESVKIDERMATGKKLKFGLCEGSSLEFQYFDHPNINGKDIQVFVSIEYVDENGDLAWYDIPMGWYTVDQCPVQWSTGIYKVTAYNKLKSQYLDNKANALIDDAFGDLSSGQTVKFYDIRRLLLKDYEIDFTADEVEISVVPGVYNWKKCGEVTKMKAKYGINTPLSWEEMTDLTDYTIPLMNLYPLSYSRGYAGTLTASEAYTFDTEGLTELEKKIYDTIKDIVDLSMTTSGQTFVNNMMNTYTATIAGQSATYNGWCDFFGIILTKEDNTTEKYSTIAYQNGVSNVVGSYDDLGLKTLKGYTKIQINVPYLLSFDSSLDFQYSVAYHFVNPWAYDSYGYFTDSSMINIDYDRYKFTTPDGTPVDNTDVYLDYLSAYNINLTDADLIDVDPLSLADITLREALSAVYEIDACYGKLDRTTDLFAPVELNQGGLYPQDTLYPVDNLYPQGNMVHPFPSSYQKLWTDTIGEQSFRYLIITYKTMENGQEVEKTLQRTVNTYGTTNYNMSDNWLFRNLIWNASDVGDYADAMVLKMKDIRWFPFEMWAAGLPHIETGDAIEITDKNGNTHTSYVLTRTLDGIQNLQDTFINGELDIF